jgi:hypothetical protein
MVGRSKIKTSLADFPKGSIQTALKKCGVEVRIDT